MNKTIWNFPGQLSVTVYPKETGVCVLEVPGVRSKTTRSKAADLIREYRKALRLKRELE